MTKSNFKYADYNPKRETVPAYFVQNGGSLQIGEVSIIDGEPTNGNNRTLLANDSEIVELKGWRHKKCASFEEGTILIPLKK
jgi:hypothetical protein